MVRVRSLAVAALAALAGDGTLGAATVQKAIERFDIDPEAAPPWTR